MQKNLIQSFQHKNQPKLHKARHLFARDNASQVIMLLTVNYVLAACDNNPTPPYPHAYITLHAANVR